VAKKKLESAKSGLTHFDAAGQARMVDVSVKPETHRTAIASAVVTMRPATAKLVAEGEMKKGDVLAVARIAGIGGIKRTSDLTPLCLSIEFYSMKCLCSIISILYSLAYCSIC